MKIKSLKLHPVAVERQYGTVIAKEGGKANRTVKKSFFYYVELLTDNGLTGWGELSDVEPHNLPKDAAEYGELLAAFVAGRSPLDVQRMHREFREHFDMSGGLGQA